MRQYLALPVLPRLPGKASGLKWYETDYNYYFSVNAYREPTEYIEYVFFKKINILRGVLSN